VPPPILTSVEVATVNRSLFQCHQLPAAAVSTYSWDIRPKELRLPGGPSQPLGSTATPSNIPVAADMELNGTAIKERLMANRLPESCV
jgi:hypothetical protein